MQMTAAMRLNIQVKMIVQLFFINLCVQCAFSYTYVNEDDDKEDGTLYQYNNKRLQVSNPDKDVKLVRQKVDTIERCVRIYLEEKGKSLNILGEAKNITCQVLNIDWTNELLSDTNAIFVTKRKPMTSGYCKNLRYLNLCGVCKCVDTIGLSVPYYCNCKKEPVMKNCNSFARLNYTKSGIYKINPDGQELFRVYCEFKEDGRGWIVIFRLLTPQSKYSRNKDSDSFRDGFGYLFYDMWLGSQYIHRLTNATTTKLLVEGVEDQSYQKVSELYNKFSVDADYKIDYALDDTTTGSVLEKGSPLVRCYHEQWWRTKCDGHKADIHWGQKYLRRLSMYLDLQN